MFIVPLKAPGVEIKPVYTFQDERTNITYYDGVKIPDSYRLGEVNGGVKVMSAGLELEHGGGFSKSLAKHGASRRRIVPGNRLSRPAADRGPRRAGAARAGESASAVVRGPCLARALGRRREEAQSGFRSDGEAVFVREVPDGLGRSSESYGAVFAVEARGSGRLSSTNAIGTPRARRIYGGTSEIHRSMIAERNAGAAPQPRA